MTPPSSAGAGSVPGARARGPERAPSQGGGGGNGRRELARSTLPVRRRSDWARLFRPALPWTIGLAAAVLLDQLVYARLAITDPARLARLTSYDLYRMFRALGSLWPWLMVAAVLLLIDSGAARSAPRRLRAGARRATFLLLSALLSGGAAELLKPIIGRFKPDNTNGGFEFAGLTERFSRWSDMSMASSHAAVAFGAAMALSVMFPRGTPVFLLGAIGCGLTRLLAGAHYLSDVYAAVLLAYGVTRAIYYLDARNNEGKGIGAQVWASGAAR